MSKRLVINSISGTTLYIINMLIVFMLSPIIVRVLGNRDYGIWELVMSVVGYMGLLDLGIGPALLRYVAIYNASGDKEELQKTISTAMMFFVTIGLLASVLFIGLSSYPFLLTGGEQVDPNYIASVLLLFAVNAVLVFPLNVLVATLLGVQRHYLVNATRMVFGIVRASIAYYLLVTYPAKGLLLLAVLEPVFNLLQFGVYAVALQRDLSIPGFSFSACTVAKLKELLIYGSKSAMLMIASRIQSTSLPFVVSTILGVSNVIYFAMPDRLVGYAKGLSLAMGFPLTPYLAAQMEGDDKVAVRTSWLQTTLAFQIITMAMPLILFFCGERFLSVWLGKEYGVAGRGVLYCLIIALFVESVAPNASKILLASGHHGRAALLWLGLAIMSIPVAVFGAYQWGVTGVALGSSIALILGNIVMLKMACTDVGVNLTAYLRQTACRLLIPLLLLAICLWSTGLLFSAESYLHLVLQVITSGVIYLIAMWFLTLSQDNRIRITDKVRTLFEKGGIR